MNDVNLPLMMRQARSAIFAHNYEEAAILYATLIAHEEMADNFDIKVRHAFCIEKTGHTKQAIKLYQGIAGLYKEAGEPGAAASVEQTIAMLVDDIEKKYAAAKAEEERVKAEKSRAKEAAKKAKLAEAKARAKEAAKKARLQAEEASAKEAAEKARLQAEEARAKEEAKARLAAESFLKAQAEIEKLRAEKAKEEARLEKNIEEEIWAEKLRAKKAQAEKARAERALAKKVKQVGLTESQFTATVKMETLALSDVDEDELKVFDLSETGVDEKEKSRFDITTANHPPWV
ncbi:MAG: hypothetical protein Q9M20_04400 [Mariprofundaceae bacterium]|nr:hypothetical protein [Mariprofundaceae bacterium]